MFTASRFMLRTMFFLVLPASALVSTVEAQVNVRGYYRSNGTYVAPHYRTSPDGNPYNNYSTPIYTNPYVNPNYPNQPGTRQYLPYPYAPQPYQPMQQRYQGYRPQPYQRYAYPTQTGRQGSWWRGW